MLTLLAILTGTIYGLIIGIIPGVGATTGLVILFGAMNFFAFTPYLGVIFLMAVVAASTTADTYSGVLLGIPGANSASATMIDGYPLALQGRANYALSAAITTSTVNGLLWGSLTFLFLPYYSQIVLILGIPELWALVMLSLATVGFLGNRFWIRSLIAICLGLFIGFIGIDPITGVDRLTFGFEYLADGIQIMPVVAGLFAIPEILSRLFDDKRKVSQISINQTKDGIISVWLHKWTALRGGLIGSFIGLLPGLGGAVSDWLSYSATVAANPNEKFGNGNIKGVIGPEGSNNAQKATSMIPTVMFGIPGASFAAILMGLFAYLGFEMGSPDILVDSEFFRSMTFGFLSATVLISIICLFFNRLISKLLLVPFKYYFPIILGLIIWSCMLYTGGISDLIILCIFSILGFIMRKWKFSRPALVIAYILSPKVETLTIQLTSLYTIDSLLGRPIFIIIFLLTILLLIWSVLNKNRIDYA